MGLEVLDMGMDLACWFCILSVGFEFRVLDFG